MLTDFKNPFTDRFNSKFAVTLIIPPHLKRVVTLPCETSKKTSDNLKNASLSATNHNVVFEVSWVIQ